MGGDGAGAALVDGDLQCVAKGTSLQRAACVPTHTQDELRNLDAHLRSSRG